MKVIPDPQPIVGYFGERTMLQKFGFLMMVTIGLAIVAVAATVTWSIRTARRLLA